MKKIILLLLSYIIYSLSLISQPFNEQDSLNLKVFWQAMDGPNWEVYDWTGPIAEWDGLSWREGSVSHINLRSRDIGMEGSIPAEIGKLSELESLGMTNQKVIGTLPAEINQLKKLKVLSINGFNTIDNSAYEIPDLSGLTSLRQLDIWMNVKLGDWSTWVKELPVLESLVLVKVIINGPIPEWFSELNLSTIVLRENGISGTIPNLSSMNLTTLSISDQKFDPSSFPEWISSIPTLTRLILENANLEGEVPGAIFDNEELIVFNVIGNKLTGDLSSMIDNTLPKLLDLKISNNQFSGILNPNFFNPEVFKEIKAENNRLTGIGDFTSFDKMNFLNLRNNGFPHEEIELLYPVFKDRSSFTYTDQLYESPDSIILMEDESVTLDAISDGENDVYTWFYNGEILEGENSKTLIISTEENEPGYYRCSIENTLTDGSSMLEESSVIYETTSSIDIQHSTPEWKVYPQPAHDFVTVSGIDGITIYSIYDLQGRLIRSGKYDGQIDVSSLHSGHYVLAIDRGTRKIVIK